MSEQTQNLYHFWIATSVGVVLEGHLSVGLLDLGLSGGLLDTEHFVEFFVVYLLRGGIGVVATAGEASRHAIEKAVKEHIPVFCLDGSIYEKLLFLKKKNIFVFQSFFFHVEISKDFRSRIIGFSAGDSRDTSDELGDSGRLALFHFFLFL